MTESDQKIIDEALENYKNASDSMKNIWEDAEDDLNFVAGNHWSHELKAERRGRPCLVINKLPTYINQVTNDQRQNRAAIKTRPVDDISDPEKAKVINGIIRHIQYNSDAEAAIDTATDYSVSCGIGFIRIKTDWSDDEGFTQEIFFDRIDDPFSVVYPVHLCKQADWSDAPYCFVVTQMEKKAFEAKYGVDASNWEDTADGWVEKDKVRICEYFKVVEKPKKLFLIEDGSIVDKLPEGVVAVKERDTKERTVEWCLLTSKAILEKNTFPSRYLPIVPVLAKEHNVKGDKRYISLTRFAKDPQRMLNYWKSHETEMIALQPKVPFIGASGQFKGHESEWKQAHVKNYPYLEYEPVSHNGQPLPAPQRSMQAQIPTAIVNAINEAKEDIKETTGIFDASMGAQGNETSGRAILARQREGDTATFHFIDNVNRALRHCGRIIVDLIPKIYDTERVVQILGEDMKPQTFTVNKAYIDPATGQPSILYDVTVGKYDVIVDTGPSYTTKRIEAAESLTAFAQAVPSAGEIIGDLIATNMDWPGAEDMANRLKKLINMKYPKLIDEPGNGQGSPISEQELQAILQDLQALQQQLQMSEHEKAQMADIIRRMQQDLADKEADRRVEIEKARIQADADITEAEIKIKPEMMQQVIGAANNMRGGAGYFDEPRNAETDVRRNA